LWTVTNLSFKHKIKIKLPVSNLSFFINIHNATVNSNNFRITNTFIQTSFSQWPTLSPTNIG
jgi:hypothetical protein